MRRRSVVGRIWHGCRDPLRPRVARSAQGVPDAWPCPQDITCFFLLGLAVWGVPVLTDAWPAIAIAAAVSSLALLIAFWDVHLVFGLTLDLVIIVVAVMHPSWTQQTG